MPHPPRVKVRVPLQAAPNQNLPFLNELPPQVQEEVKEKLERGEKHVQFRMPLDVWARMRARHFEMNRDAEMILEKNHLPLPSKNSMDLVPMSEIIRKMFDNPLKIKDNDIVGMVHKRGKGRVFL